MNHVGSEVYETGSGATSYVEIQDYSIWIKHVRGSSSVSAYLSALRGGQAVTLRVDGHVGVWEKMRDGTHGLPTNGLKPIGAMRGLWGDLYKSRKGELVSLEIVDGPDYAIGKSPENPNHGEASSGWEEASLEERDAAWSAFKALMDAGWRSVEGAGSRDELHERNI